MQQQLLKLDKGQLDSRIKQELYNASIPATKEKPYEELRLKKSCPNCGSDSLIRYTKPVSGEEMPVVPIYLCKSCNRKSYHLTTAYLEYLIKSNTDLFAQSELLELNKKHEAFVKELEGYILRIFASKKIMRIK